MLSRLAESLYWVGRYLERVEDTTRLVDFHWQAMKSVSRETAKQSWEVLLRSMGSDAAYAERYTTVTERNVMNLLVTHEDDARSLASSAQALRVNVQTSREWVPPALCDAVNRLERYIHENAEQALTRKRRLAFTDGVLIHSHVVSAIVEGALSRGVPYQFFRIGRAIERADMATRCLDICSTSLPSHGDDDPFVNLRWMRLLEAFDALAVYRLEKGPRVLGDDVMDLLLRTAECPRSVAFCLAELDEALHGIPTGETLKSAVRRVRRRLIRATSQDFATVNFSDYLERLQLAVMRLDGRIRYQFFETA